MWSDFSLNTLSSVRVVKVHSGLHSGNSSPLVDVFFFFNCCECDGGTISVGLVEEKIDCLIFYQEGCTEGWWGC